VISFSFFLSFFVFLRRQFGGGASDAVARGRGGTCLLLSIGCACSHCVACAALRCARRPRRATTHLTPATHGRISPSSPSPQLVFTTTSPASPCFAFASLCLPMGLSSSCTTRTRWCPSRRQARTTRRTTPAMRAIPSAHTLTVRVQQRLRIRSRRVLSENDVVNLRAPHTPPPQQQQQQ
jgi:hypothetical protein